jgi:hypothetical protein
MSRANIATGPYQDRQGRRFDPDTFVNPADAVPGSYLSVGPGAPEGCDPVGCHGDSNDGTQRWIADVPRTVPGSLGADRRPDG